MRKLRNTLYVTLPHAYLSKEGETVLVRQEQETRLRLPILALEGIVCFGQVSMSPALMAFCAESGVGVSFLSEHGRFLARVEGPIHGNVLLRREQYRRSDSEPASVAIARSVLLAKIANCRTAILRSAREHPSGTLDRTADQLAGSLRSLQSANCLDALRGIEGDAAHGYFSVFDEFILQQKETFHFHERSRRPPLDNVNALLSFLYVLLAHDVASALETVGLDPAVGFLHRDRPGRAGLALDLMEELRPVLADRLALTLINRRQVVASGFSRSESGGVSMSDETRKEVLVAWQNRKQEEILHPFLDERIPFGLIPYAQALLLARHLRGDLDAYPSFFWR
ncbi:MAG TPA: type I-C CRISPR-associated endonuclease Cas1c [Bryobacteraceae bacterium]|nr:type I-C CRISPR-associated endonuclease Cas1c [Bryobacteraceae bacterium]